MSWLDEIVRPKILTRSKRDVKANVWVKCPSCAEMIYRRDIDENLGVCECGHHNRISVESRMSFLVDADSRQTIPVVASKNDPLTFKDRKKYTDRLKSARKNGAKDAFLVEQVTIKGEPLIVCVMDFAFMAGSMGAYVGEAIVVAAMEAKKLSLPLMLITASGGARMQEGIISLMQMVRTTAAITELKEAGLPYIVLLTDPTTGGVSASFAMIGDITIAEPGAMIGFAGPRVIEQTIGETLPEGFQSAEYLLEHGMVDIISPRLEQAETIANILSLLTANKKDMSCTV